MNLDEYNQLFNTEILTGPYAHMTVIEKFFSLIKKDDCWLFTGKLFSNGYGDFRFRLKGFLAHRISYIYHYGTVPESAQVVMHSCDVRNCVNPAHLSVGSHSDNAIDMLSKGRGVYRKGIKHPRGKLSDADVLRIRELRQQGVFGVEIAELYKVAPATIFRIGKGTRRGYVTNGI